MKKTFSWSFLFAAAVFLHYLLLPYPRFFQTSTPGGHWPTPLGLIFIVSCMALWFLCVRDHVRPSEISEPSFSMLRADWAFIVLFLITFLLVHRTYLNRPVTWCGDEDFHIERSMHFVNEVMRLDFWSDNPVLRFGLKRYPPFVLPLQAIAANPLFGTFHEPWAYRIVSFFCLALFCALPYFALRKSIGLLLAAGVSLATASIPLVFVFSSLVYIEPLLVLLEGIVLFRLMAGPLSTRGAWSAVLIASTLGLVKETSLPFLAAISIWICVRVWQGAFIAGGTRIYAGLKFLGALWLPSIPYLVIRFLCSPRADERQGLANLLSPHFYEYSATALLTQVTPIFLVASIAGLVLMMRSKSHRDAAIVALLSLGGYATLYSLDVLAFTGFARFTLCYMPALALGFAGLFKVSRFSRFRAAIIIAVVIAGASSAIPWSVESHEKWIMPGQKDYPTGAWKFYPYDQACAYLATQPDSFAVCSGARYYLPLAFLYVPRLDLSNRYAEPMMAAIPLSEAAMNCRKRGVPLLLYQSSHQGTAELPDSSAKMEPLVAERQFQLGGNTLALYRIAAKCEETSSRDSGCGTQ